MSLPSQSTLDLRQLASTDAQPGPPTLDLLGVPLSLVDYDGVLSWMDGMVATRRRGYVCVAATHMVMAAQEDRGLREAVLGSSLVVPDGQPLVWALNALGAQLGSRVYGPTLMSMAMERGIELGHRHFLYGGRDDIALAALASNLRRRHPGVKIVDGHAPPFRPLTEDEEDRIVERIARSRADVVWVGIGAPKQEKWMARFRERLDAPVLLGVGAAFDFHAGLVPQAPTWMQEAGLEWAFRLAREPRRLWRRYLRYNPLFVTGFARQYARQRLSGS